MSFAIKTAKLLYGTDNRLRSYKKISAMLKNGVGIDDILNELFLLESHDGKKPDESMAIVYSEWRSVIQEGRRFSDAVDGWIPQSERMIILAGEDAGDLPAALLSLIRVVTASRVVKSTVISGLLYPVILLLASFGILYLFGVKVIPEFTRMMDPNKWGSVAYSLYILSEFTRNYFWLMLGTIVAVVSIVVWSMPRWTGPLRTIADKGPFYSLYRLLVGSGFMLALSSMMSTSGGIKDGLMTLNESSTKYLGERIDAILLGINSGMDAGEAFINTGYDFPSKELVMDLGVYARHSGDFSAAIKIVADEWMQDGLEQVKSSIKVISGLSIVTIAGLLAWIVGGFFAIQQEIAMMSKAMGG